MATTAAPTVGLCDDDIVRYWQVFAETAEDAAFAIAGTPQASHALARASVEQLAHNPTLQARAELRMLEYVAIDDATFHAAYNHRDQRASAALANPHCATQVTALLAQQPRLLHPAAGHNPGLSPELLEQIAEAHRYPVWIAKNPAMPTTALERMIAGCTPQTRDVARYAVLPHPNAAPEFVYAALRTRGEERIVAAQWPGLSVDELRELAAERGSGGRAPTGVALVAKRMLRERHAPAGARYAREVARHELIVEVAELLRDRLDGDTAAAAAAKLVTAGFGGTVDELCEIANTFG